ncbi:MAG: proton-conducting transporter membrane subunit, partial [Pseudomonadota bacterium]
MFFVSLLLILGTGLLALLLRRRASTLRLVSVVGISAGCVLGVADAVQVLATRGEHSATLTALNTLPFAFRIDGLAAFFLLAIFVVALLATVYSAHYLDWVADTSRAAAGSFFLALLVVSMALVVSAASIIAFLLAWELMSLSSFFLVLYHFEHDDNRRAGLIYLVYSQLGALVLMVAFALLYSFSGDLILGQGAAVPESARTWLFVLFFIGFGSKAGVFPLHAWLPHAHPAAPSHVSAVMSGVMIKTGIYGILRVTTVLDLATPTAAQIVVVAGAASGVLGVVYALGQHDLKRLLAYHSVENIGIILLGLGLGMLGLAHQRPALAVLGFTGGLLHVLNHALFKGLLFLCAGAVQHATHTLHLEELGGLLRRMPRTGFMFLLGAVAISGLPPLNGFVSEFLILLAGLRGVASLGGSD